MPKWSTSGPQEEFEKGHIIDAINISADQLSGQLRQTEETQGESGIVFCCASGAVSTKEARKLMHEGYEKVLQS